MSVSSCKHKNTDVKQYRMDRGCYTYFTDGAKAHIIICIGHYDSNKKAITNIYA